MNIPSLCSSLMFLSTCVIPPIITIYDYHLLVKYPVTAIKVRYFLNQRTAKSMKL